MPFRPEPSHVVDLRPAEWGTGQGNFQRMPAATQEHQAWHEWRGPAGEDVRVDNLLVIGEEVIQESI